MSATTFCAPVDEMGKHRRVFVNQGFKSRPKCRRWVLREYGHHATYFITEEKVRAYGEHARKERVNFWGVGFTPRP